MTGARVAALVAGRALTQDAVEDRVAALRRGPLASRLPRPGTADARNLRRWVVQVMTFEAVVEDAARELGVGHPTGDGPAGGPGAPGVRGAHGGSGELGAPGAPEVPGGLGVPAGPGGHGGPGGPVAGSSPGRSRGMGLSEALRMGGMTAAVLASLPVAHAVRDRVTAAVTVPETAVRDYFDRNRDLYAVPYDEARPAIERELRRAAVDRHFALWLERRHAASVTLLPGFEHPADPRHADATHRH